MKKVAFLSLILALSMLFSLVLTSCGGNDDTSDTEKSQNESVNQSENQSADDSSEDDNSDTESSTDEAETFTYETVISTGKTYVSDPEPYENKYPDSYNSELTDGLFAGDTEVAYTDEKLSGYAPSSGYNDFIVDLGEVKDRIYMFKVRYLISNVAGISGINKANVYYSDDSENWTRAGMTRNSGGDLGTMGVATLTLKNSISARYIRFRVYRSSSWFFLDEIMVIADIESAFDEAMWKESIDLLYKSEQMTSDERKEALDSISGSAPDFSLNKTLVSKGASYQISSDTLSPYEDTGTMLTDGNISGFIEGGTWVGIQPEGNVTIDILLSKKRTDVAGFALYTFMNRSAMKASPRRVTVYVSNDKKNWTEVGRVYATTEYDSDVFTYEIMLSRTVTAKYVRFILEDTDSTMFFVEEAAVYAYTSETEQKSLYPAIDIPEVKENIYWDSTEKDYKTQINLIKGLGQQIASSVSVDEKQWENNTPASTKLLTDGKYSDSTNIHGGGFCKFNYGSSRDIIYDIGKVSALSYFKAGFTNQTDWAVYAPGGVAVYVSVNGVDWYSVGVITLDNSKTPAVLRSELKLDTPVLGRFVCFSFEVKQWAGCDELEAYGTKDISKAKSAESLGYSVRSEFNAGKYQAPSEDILGGVEDLLLIYHSQSNSRTVEDLIPVIAYVDENGNIKDTMFDGFLFILSGKLPSGDAGHNGFRLGDVTWLVNTLFEDGKNISALEEAGETVKKSLGLPDNTKFKFYLTLYFPAQDAEFGDMNGDGVNEKLTTTALRLQAVEYLINKLEEAMSKKTYKNIEFAGYYWYDESMNDSAGDLELLQSVSEIVKKHNSQLFWIPYYEAAGYQLWTEHGFVSACMQPNYAFALDRPIERIENTASICRRYGMGIEIEIDGQALKNDSYREHYMEYLKGGIYYGYIENCIHMYYAEFSAYQNAAKSDNPKNRAIYDYTYRFIKGTLDIYPDELDGMEFNAAKDTALKSTLNNDNNGIRSYILDISPEHGTVTLNPDGSFTYYPDKGFTGTDRFTYTYNELLAESLPCEVVINVK